jgi:hypothetical protein
MGCKDTEPFLLLVIVGWLAFMDEGEMQVGAAAIVRVILTSSQVACCVMASVQAKLGAFALYESVGPQRDCSVFEVPLH